MAAVIFNGSSTKGQKFGYMPFLWSEAKTKYRPTEKFQLSIQDFTSLSSISKAQEPRAVVTPLFNQT